MSFLGNIMKSVINPATLLQVAMGPAGWASIAIKAIGTAVAQQVIQALGEKLGLPQGLINMAKDAFTTATGTKGMPTSVGGAVDGLTKQFNLSPTQSGQLERSINESLAPILDNIKNDRYSVDESGGKKLTGKAAGGKSWIMQIAELLGNKLNEAAEELKTKADSTDWKDGKSMSEFNALNQQFSTLMSSVNTAIKSIGEALSTMARKQ